MRFFVFFSILMFSFEAFGVPCKAHTRDNFYCVKVLSVYDGDTFRVKIPGIHPKFGENIAVRVRGIDSPEIKTKNWCESVKAERAKKMAKGLLSKGRVHLINVKEGKYFRLVATVRVGRKSLANELLKHNLAVRYDGGTKPNVDWCKK